MILYQSTHRKLTLAGNQREVWRLALAPPGRSGVWWRANSRRARQKSNPSQEIHHSGDHFSQGRTVWNLELLFRDTTTGNSQCQRENNVHFWENLENSCFTLLIGSCFIAAILLLIDGSFAFISSNPLIHFHVQCLLGCVAVVTPSIDLSDYLCMCLNLF